MTNMAASIEDVLMLLEKSKYQAFRRWVHLFTDLNVIFDMDLCIVGEIWNDFDVFVYGKTGFWYVSIG